MKQYWQRYAAKLDARNQRERVLIFAMVLVVAGSLLNILLLDPLLAGKKQLAQEVMQQQEQLHVLQAQIQVAMSGGRADPDAATRVRLAGLEQKLAQSRAALESMQQSLVPPDKMARLLDDVLKQNRSLKLISLKTLPVSGVLDAPESKQSPLVQVKAAEEAKPVGPAIYKHGVKIAVSGNYAELMQYLNALEKLPWRMFWGNAEMRVEEYPKITLTITLYTLSTDKTWMAI